MIKWMDPSQMPHKMTHIKFKLRVQPSCGPQCDFAAHCAEGTQPEELPSGWTRVDDRTNAMPVILMRSSGCPPTVSQTPTLVWDALQLFAWFWNPKVNSFTGVCPTETLYMIKFSLGSSGELTGRELELQVFCPNGNILQRTCQQSWVCVSLLMNDCASY